MQAVNIWRATQIQHQKSELFPSAGLKGGGLQAPEGTYRQRNVP